MKLFLNHVLPGDGPIYVSILVLLAIACVFTIAGGLTAVIWTDFIQASAPCSHDKDGSFDEISTFSTLYSCFHDKDGSKFDEISTFSP